MSHPLICLLLVTCAAGLAAVEFSPIMEPSEGCLWGAWTHHSNDSWDARLDDLEAQIGRRFDIVHHYHRWDQDIPTAAEAARAREGQLLLLNLKPPTGESWPKLARGDFDARIDEHADRFKALKPHKVFLAFHHEPEDNVGSYGSVHDYAAAFRRLRDRFEARGADNVIWVWNIMGYSGWYDQYTGGLYPGDDYVDWIAWDPYNWAACRNAEWRSFENKIAVFYDWLMDHGFGHKPFMLGEYGTEVDTDGDETLKPLWFDGIVPALQNRFPNLKAVVYFNAHKECNWLIDNPPEALPHFVEAGQQPWVNVLFGGDGEAPTIAEPAAAASDPVTGQQVELSVLGADDDGEASLTYTWSATGPATVHFSANGGNAAKRTTATFTAAGDHRFTVTIADADGLTVEDGLTLSVAQTASGLRLAP